MARESLAHPPVVLTLDQIGSIGRGFARELAQFAPAIIYACAILRDHFHLVTGPCRYDVRRFAGRMKGAASKQLLDDRIHPMSKYADAQGVVPAPWSVKPWVVYQFDDSDMLRSIKYVNDNVKRSRLPVQQYPFVVPYRSAQGTPGAAHRR